MNRKQREYLGKKLSYCGWSCLGLSVAWAFIAAIDFAPWESSITRAFTFSLMWLFFSIASEYVLLGGDS